MMPALFRLSDSTRRGLEEAVAYARGEANESDYRVHVPAVIDVGHSNETRYDSGRVCGPVRIQCEYAAPLGTGQTPT
jgi:hypothetical protein